MSWKIKAKFPIFVRFSIFLNFATLRGVPLVISFKLSPTLGNFLERFTLWPCPPNSSISLLLSKALANFSHFRQICHLLQNRRCDFSPSSPLFWGGTLCLLIGLAGKALEIFRYFGQHHHFRQNHHFQRASFAFSLKILLRLANVRHTRCQLQIRHFRQICHFHQNRNS